MYTHTDTSLKDANMYFEIICNTITIYNVTVHKKRKKKVQFI